MEHAFQTFWNSNRLAWRIVRITSFLTIGTIILVMAFEDKLIFFPSKYPDGLWDTQDTCTRDGEIIPGIEDCRIVTADGVALHAWYCTPHRCKSGSGEPVKTEMLLLWFHGNAGNISYRYEMIRGLMELPVDVLIVDYRGYGKSEGKPTERGLYLDARAAWDYLVNERGISPRRIIIFGKSLGGVPAVDLATNVDAAGLIVQSSFTSAADMAAFLMPFVPRVLLRTKMDSISKIARVRCPKLFIHGSSDEIVPYELGRRLYEAAPEPKQFYEVKGAPHNSTYLVGGKDYFETLRAFVRSLTPSQ